MRKILIMLLICGIAVASILSTSTLVADARHARDKIRASGEWTYVSLGKDIRSGEGYMFILGEETGTWTGTFTGTSHDYFQAVKQPSGVVYLSYGLIFFEGTVDGRYGTLVISFAPGENVGGEWSGKWKILSGTGDLENLSGQGKWWGPSQDLDYKGRIYFEDDDYDDDD